MAWIRGLSDIPMKNARIKVRVIKPFSNKALVEYEVSLGIVVLANLTLNAKTAS